MTTKPERLQQQTKQRDDACATYDVGTAEMVATLIIGAVTIVVVAALPWVIYFGMVACGLI